MLLCRNVEHLFNLHSVVVYVVSRWLFYKDFHWIPSPLTFLFSFWDYTEFVLTCYNLAGICWMYVCFWLGWRVYSTVKNWYSELCCTWKYVTRLSGEYCPVLNNMCIPGIFVWSTIQIISEECFLSCKLYWVWYISVEFWIYKWST